MSDEWAKYVKAVDWKVHAPRTQFSQPALSCASRVTAEDTVVCPSGSQVSKRASPVIVRTSPSSQDKVTHKSSPAMRLASAVIAKNIAALKSLCDIATYYLTRLCAFPESANPRPLNGFN
jgi:hypothetical protein